MKPYLALRRVCRRTPLVLAALAVGLLALSINAAVVAVRPPTPRVHDEFAYLLAADTFASGRLTNRPHTYWPHFETMHVIHQPSYQAKYPPGQGAMLALGQVAVGSPVAGLCLGSGLLAAAAVWMLAAWFPRRWAVFGGLMVALHAGVQLQWGACYWGGSLAMAAAALMLGGAGRMANPGGPRFGPSLAYACGAVLLALTRPFEGAIMVAGSGLVVLVSRRNTSLAEWRRFALRAMLPTVIVGAGGLAVLMTYNHAVTGDPLRMPYVVYEKTYGVTPIFVWQHPNYELRYRHPVLTRFNYTGAMWSYQQQRTLEGLVTMKTWFTGCALGFFLPAPAALAALAYGWFGARRRLMPWVAVAAVTWAASCHVVWMFPHYLAPAAPVLLLTVVAVLRLGRTFERRLAPQRRWITPSVLAVQAVLLAAVASDYFTASQTTWAHARQAIGEKLQQTPGDDLVFVHYADDHNVHDEWVFNAADIDNAPVVWAREMNQLVDDRLRRHFAGRRAWTVYADENPIRIEPRPASPDSIANRGPATPLGDG